LHFIKLLKHSLICRRREAGLAACQAFAEASACKAFATCPLLIAFLSILHYKDMTIFIVMQIFFNKNDYYFSHLL
jgi:hypothetical protein